MNYIMYLRLLKTKAYLKVQLLNEQEILHGLHEGSEKAFDIIFRNYWQPLFDLAASKLESMEDAEEIVQDVFASLWQRRNEQTINNLSYYLFSSVRNKIIDFIRARITKRKYWQQYQQFPFYFDQTTQDTVEANDLNAVIEKMVNTMSDKTQKIFRLNKIDGRSVNEIASSMKLSEKTIEYHLTKSVKQLRVYLKNFILILLIFLSSYPFQK